MTISSTTKTLALTIRIQPMTLMLVLIIQIQRMTKQLRPTMEQQTNRQLTAA